MYSAGNHMEIMQLDTKCRYKESHHRVLISHSKNEDYAPSRPGIFNKKGGEQEKKRKLSRSACRLPAKAHSFSAFPPVPKSFPVTSPSPHRGSISRLHDFLYTFY